MGTPQVPHAPGSGDLSSAPPPPPPPAGWPGPVGMPVPASTPTRPGTVVGAVVCWVLSGLGTLVLGGLALAVAGTQEARDAMAEIFAESETQISDEVIQQLLVASGVAGLVA